jgi:4-alpha-glucanotransferase
MRFSRASGILLHPTSLPGDLGIGDLGPEATKFVDFLVESGQTYWQILPLGPTGYGDSPYQSYSAFAGNFLLISPEKLVEDRLISKDDLKTGKPKFPTDKVDFGAVIDWKNKLLTTAYEGFRKITSGDLRTEFETFCRENAWWLDDYSLYRAIRMSQNHRPWTEWPDKFKLRDERTVGIAREQLAEKVETKKFFQFLFFRQWNSLKAYANKNGVKIIGDIPIFVALDSTDVWCRRDQFKLNADGSPKVIAGVPPDYFSKTGQLWGNPIYDWDAMLRDGFQWWIARFRQMLATVDIVRVDHFRGFCAAWEVPGTDKTAENGKWVNVPGKELFTAVIRALGDLPVVAEDLGVMTPDVEELRDEFGFPGMRILQYGFAGDARNRDLPHNYVPNSAAYTGTHDNDTAVGWWNALVKDKQRRRDHDYCLKYLKTEGREINWDLIQSVWSSVADTAIVPLQDLLGLGNEARMNLPATQSGNWSWRFTSGALTSKIAARLKDLTETYGRDRLKS